MYGQSTISKKDLMFLIQHPKRWDFQHMSGLQTPSQGNFCVLRLESRSLKEQPSFNHVDFKQRPKFSFFLQVLQAWYTKQIFDPNFLFDIPNYQTSAASWWPNSPPTHHLHAQTALSRHKSCPSQKYFNLLVPKSVWEKPYDIHQSTQISTTDLTSVCIMEL